MTDAAQEEALRKWAVIVADPYARCLETCTHDLSPGALTLEIIGPHDGPHPDPHFAKMYGRRR